MRYNIVILITLFFLAGCAKLELASHIAKTAMPSKSPVSQGNFKIGKPYKIEGRWYYPQEEYDLVETGIASWYGPGFDGKRTANGEIFNKNELTAAHRTLQMPSLVRVTNLDNGRSLIVRVNDRGPYKRGRVIDVSEKAADLLGFKGAGTAKVKLQILREESLRIAEAAKAGHDTRGYEVAVNGQALPREGSYQVASLSEVPAPYYQESGVSIESVSRETLVAPGGESARLQPIVPGHSVDGHFYPDPVVTEYPVATSNIYVQAGSFTVAENAARLSQTLSAIHESGVHPIYVNGRQFYRVRLGPVKNVSEADTLLNRLVQNGYKDSMIVVE